MSGSDPTVSNSSRGLGPAADEGADQCPTQFQTVLGSPEPSLVGNLSEGDLLDVVKFDDAPTRGVIATLLSGERVGAITRDIALLRRCIDRGVEYEAEVVRVTGGSVLVDVHRR